MNRIPKKTPQRHGLTLPELMMAIMVTVMIGLAMATLLTTIEATDEHVQSNGDVTQQARLTVERIQRTIRGAHANEQFPGLLVTGPSAASWSFPDTLVVWAPENQPASPDGLPHWDELLIFYPDVNDPTRLVEMRPGIIETIPALDQEYSPGLLTWEYEVDLMKSETESHTRVVLTSLLRTAKPTGTTMSGMTLGCLRFHVRHTPTDQELSDYDAGNKAWNSLSWPQDLRGSNFGLRQSLCHFEMQLVNASGSMTAAEAQSRAIPFFGSGAIYYEVSR